ncbi:PRTRC system ThiF family protein [Marinobacter halodurans]|uniref:PRTRC system ThiF family protein n=1 Tax=Marinobacter halodurans TaxID=2528979 RepID=A0ABY1ZML3_9GAMM|nr:PRTRC system ThiF family protein [Marinobacter halodurans]TBW57482.1 PRTRC system ThiF family protein [Marinobacter halodurans]
MSNTASTRALPETWMTSSRELNVLLIGAGGNGSEMVDGLMRIHQAMIALGGHGLNVTVADGDEVEPSNIVRQRFYPHEIGMMKSDALIHRANMLMGTSWSSHASYLAEADIKKLPLHQIDLIITAVDNLAVRQWVATEGTEAFVGCRTLWCDMGCDQDQGQVVIGELSGNTTKSRVPNAAALFPSMMTNESQPQTPSCGAAESLSRQDLMINQQVAASATNLLWKAIRKGHLPYNGAMIDLGTGLTQAIPFMPLEESA